MNFPWTRHYQRYEYIIYGGLVDDVYVADIGCGCFPIGAYAMATTAKMVFAVDPYAKPINGIQFVEGIGYGTFILDDLSKVVIIPESVFDFVGRVDVVTAVEVFEHMPDPTKFIKHLSSICNEVFITTPLAMVTGKTKNINHVAEYSDGDFNRIVSEGFTIISKKYQMGDMRIVDSATPVGCCSLCDAHIVQMVWARSRYAKT